MCKCVCNQMLCAGPNFLRQPKNLTAFGASSKTFVSEQKPISLHWHKMFVTATIAERLT